MQRQQKHFGYQPPQKQMKLMVFACFLTAGAAILGGFQAGDDPVVLKLITFYPPYNRLVLWGLGLLMLWVSWSVWKYAKSVQGKRFELAFLEDTVVMIDPDKKGSEHELFRLSKIDRFRVIERRKGKFLDIQLTTGISSNGSNRTGFASEDMDSQEEFDALVAQLRERLGSDKERR